VNINKTTVAGIAITDRFIIYLRFS
jgi:hypothetical protein